MSTYDPEKEKAREALENLTPAQRLENLEYLAFRQFMLSTDLPEVPDVPESGILTLDTINKPAQPDAAAIARGIPYDMAFARAGVENVLLEVGDASIPHLIHAIRASINYFNEQAAKRAAEDEGQPNG